MSVVNRRNAVLGWATWKIAHNLARRKARQALPKDSILHQVLIDYENERDDLRFCR